MERRTAVVFRGRLGRDPPYLAVRAAGLQEARPGDTLRPAFHAQAPRLVDFAIERAG